MTNKRILITNKKNVKIIMGLMTEEDFNLKFEVPMEIVSDILSENGLVSLYFVDGRLAEPDEIKTLKENDFSHGIDFVIFEN